MKRLLLILLGLAALGAAAPAQASIPIPWCGTDSSAVDRLPDATLGYAVHVVYARPPGAADRFGELAPRIVGDVAAMEAWWRSQDAARSPRFDLFPIACASVFGTLDVTNIALTQPISGINRAFTEIRSQLALAGLNQPEKIYLVYYDGPTGQSGRQQICGQGAPPRDASTPGMALVYLDSCGALETDSLRPVVGIHELVHVFGAVDDGAPHLCNDGHVCDFEPDLMTASLSGNELETHVLDSGRDDYYGHAGTWRDVQDSLFLERLDSPDRSAPSAPAALVVRSEPGKAVVTFSWRASTDDIGPVRYWVYENGRLRRRGDANLRAAARRERQRRHLLRSRCRCGRPPEPARHDPLQAGIGNRRRAGPFAAGHGRPSGDPPRVDPQDDQDGGGLVAGRARRRRAAQLSDQDRRPDVLRRETHGDDLARNAAYGGLGGAVDRAGNIGPTTTVPFRRLR